MDHPNELATWKSLLNKLETANVNKVSPKVLKELGNLFEHLTLQTAPRLLKDHELCLSKSEQLLGDLFDSIDLSDKPLLCSFLRMLRSYGYFRLAQITYHIDGYQPSSIDELDTPLDTIYCPRIEKSKWYELCPILPKAGTIGWKAIMNHGLVKEERKLMNACIQLLSLKLHFYSTISLMEKFQHTSALLKRNGERVAEKLFELIRDVAYDDESMIGLDAPLFNLLLPFTNEDQQAAIVEAIVEDLFKPFLQQKQFRDDQADKMYELISRCIMDSIFLQELLVSKLLDHLKCNVIRRKRRHSVEANHENGNFTLETLLVEISNSAKLTELLPKTDELDITSKNLQSSYLSYWADVIEQIIPCKTLTARSSLKILGTCSIVLVASSNIIGQDLIDKLSLLMSKAVESTVQSKLEKLFNSCSLQFLIDFTRILSEKNELLSTFDTPLQQFYKTYLNRHLRWCVVRNAKVEAEKLTEFVAFICDKDMNKNTSHLLQYICIGELASCMDSFKNRVSNKLFETFLECARTCSKKLYKFIKRNSFKIGLGYENGGEEMETSTMTDVSINGEHDNSFTLENKRAVVVEALVYILKIAIERKDQGMLDSYSDLLIKLYAALTTRVEMLIETAQIGRSGTKRPLDSHISKLLVLYIEHRDMIKAYLNYDLVERISALLIIDDPSQSSVNDGAAIKGKKLLYNQIKTKLEALTARANNSIDVYPTIINKQYNSVVDQSISSTGDFKNEKFCCHNYLDQIETLSEVSAIILGNCDINIYRKVLKNTVGWLEKCDPLDHPKVLFLFLNLESLIPMPNKDSSKSNALKEILPAISCSLIRISKSVELGPSIHAFTRAGNHQSNRAIQCCTYANCIKIYTLIFLRYPPKTTNPLITDAMQICVSSNLIQFAKYSNRLHGFFIQLASAITGMLKSICIGRKEEEILRSSMPVFLSVFSHLIRCLLIASDQQKIEELPDNPQTNGHGDGENHHLFNPNTGSISDVYRTQLELLALDIGRTLNNLSFLRVKLIDYAPHLISTYIKDIQRASCPESVRLHLNEGIFRIFNLVDAHQKERQEDVIEAGVQRKTFAGRASGSLFDMIHARLDQASREIFRDMHDNYNRFHRYLGKC